MKYIPEHDWLTSETLLKVVRMNQIGNYKEKDRLGLKIKYVQGGALFIHKNFTCMLQENTRKEILENWGTIWI